MPRRGSALVISTSSARRVLAVALDVRRHALGDRPQHPADHQAAVVVAGQVASRPPPPPWRDSARASGVAGAHGGVIGQVEHDAPAVVAVERLDRHRVADAWRPPRPPRRSLRTTSARGTGTPVAASSLFVSFLSDAMSTPSELVWLVMVARMRCWWTPWPSWTSDCVVQADRRDVAQRGLVEERLGRRAEGGALGEQDELSRARRRKSKSGLGADEVVDQPHRQAPGGQADALLAVRVDDVVAPGLAGAARLAAADLGARLALQLERDVLGHVARPRCRRAGARRSRRRARCRTSAGRRPGSIVEQRLGEAGDRVRRELLEHAEVDDQLDGRLVAPVVRPAVDARLDDLQLAGGLELLAAGRGALASSPSSARRSAAWRARCSFARLLVAMARAERAPPPRALRGGVVGALGRDAADQAAGAVRGAGDARQLAIGGATPGAAAPRSRRLRRSNR